MIFKMFKKRNVAFGEGRIKGHRLFCDEGRESLHKHAMNEGH